MAYLLLMTVSAAGFVLRIVGSAAGWLQIDLPMADAATLWLFKGVFLTFAPLVICATMTRPAGTSADPGSLDHLLVELPWWRIPAAIALVGYAMLNLALYAAATSGPMPEGGFPSWLDLRLYSGHGLLFYGLATAGYYGLWRRQQRRRRVDQPR